MSAWERCANRRPPTVEARGYGESAGRAADLAVTTGRRGPREISRDAIGLQQAVRDQQLLNPVVDANSIIAPLLLAAVLSIAASIFAARKSETQSFVSVEDFWGGALVGFLIGYSGTAAFESLTRISNAA